MKKTIAVLPGDGIGPEITAQAVKALDAVAERFSHEFVYRYADIGAVAIDRHGEPYPDSTHKVCMESDAVLFGAIGDPKYDNDPSARVRPEQGLLKMRKALGLQSIDFQIMCENLAVWDSVKIFDPEQASSTGHAYPIPRRFSLQIYLNF